MHGYRALEGTFLGGCLFSGRTAGRALAAGAGLDGDGDGVRRAMPTRLRPARLAS